MHTLRINNVFDADENDIRPEWKPDAVICVGCLIKGDTMHFEYRPELLPPGR